MAVVTDLHRAFLIFARTTRGGGRIRSRAAEGRVHVLDLSLGDTVIIAQCAEVVKACFCKNRANTADFYHTRAGASYNDSERGNLRLLSLLIQLSLAWTKEDLS